MAQTGAHYRKRHAAGPAISRETHGAFGFDPSVPTEEGMPSRAEQVTEGGISPGAVTGGAIADGSLDDVAKFASTIRPVVVVETNPTLPDDDYPEGSFIYNTTDSPPRLYKNEGDVWVAAVGPDDIQAHSITAGQIAAGAISTDELAVGARLTGEYANESGDTPGVFIDSSGLLIRDGKLTIRDEFDSATAGASGFSGGWADFISAGLYNATLDGPVGTIADGRTSAVPYWTVSRTGSPTLSRISLSAYPAGTAVKFLPAAQNDQVVLLSDPVAIRAMTHYGVAVLNGGSITGGTIRVEASILYYDSTDTLVHTTTLGSFLQAPTTPLAEVSKSGASSEAPDGARTARVRLRVTQEDAAPSGSYALLGFAMLQQASVTLDSDQTYVVDQVVANYGQFDLGAEVWGEFTAGADAGFRVNADGAIEELAGNTSSTYTPALTNAGTATFTTRTGKYIQIGKMVFVTIEIVINAVGSGGGTLEISLPLAPELGTPSKQYIGGYAEGMSTFDGALIGVIGNNPNLTRIRSYNGTNMARSNFVAGGRIVFEGWYRAA